MARRIIHIDLDAFFVSVEQDSLTRKQLHQHLMA
ncbi:hypothetical protein ES707_16544 [subsurface metagenome]